MPGNYNDVAEWNLGQPCARDDECFSPHGLGRCVGADTGAGRCSVIDCGDEYPSLVCPDGASCVRLGEDALCLPSCETASDCIVGDACVPMASAGLVCTPSCTAASECRAGERCEGGDCASGGCRCVSD